MGHSTLYVVNVYLSNVHGLKYIGRNKIFFESPWAIPNQPQQTNWSADRSGTYRL